MNNENEVKMEIEVDVHLAEADRYFTQSTDEEERRRAFDIYINLYASGVMNPVMFQRLGYFYYYGCLVTKNTVKGKKFYERAAQLGDGISNAFLGYLYEEGENVDKDINRAIIYYRAGGVGGNAWCLHHLGELYREGVKVPQDIYLARMYYEQAIEHGYVDSYCSLVLIFNNMAKVQNPIERQFYEEKAFDYAQAGYKAGAFGAAGFLGLAYAFEKGVKHNYELAIKYYKEAIEEYKNANVSISTIKYMESFLKEVETENEHEKSILYAYGVYEREVYDDSWKNSYEIKMAFLFAIIALVSYFLLELSGSIQFLFSCFVCMLITIGFLVTFIIKIIERQ